MNVLEKILEEIDNYAIEFETFGMCDDYVSVGWVKEIIRSHINDGKDTNVHSNGGWIPCSERLPEVDEKVLVTVKHSEWIADFYSEWVSKEEKIKHPETSGTYIGYINDNGIWIFIDEDGQENICDKEFGQDLGKIYDVVTHWQPLPEPYKPNEPKASKVTQKELEDFWTDK